MKDLIKNLPLIGSLLVIVSIIMYFENIDSDDLVKLKINVHGKPRVGAHKGLRYYIIETNNTNCQFETSSSAYNAINQDPELKNRFLSLNSGDEIEISILQDVTTGLNLPNCKVEIYGLKVGTLEVISARQIAEEGNHIYKIPLAIGVLSILTAIGIWIVKS